MALHYLVQSRVNRSPDLHGIFEEEYKLFINVAITGQFIVGIRSLHYAVH